MKLLKLRLTKEFKTNFIILNIFCIALLTFTIITGINSLSVVDKISCGLFSLFPLYGNITLFSRYKHRRIDRNKDLIKARKSEGKIKFDSVKPDSIKIIDSGFLLNCTYNKIESQTLFRFIDMMNNEVCNIDGKKFIEVYRK